MPRSRRGSLEVPVADQRRAQVIRAVLASVAEHGLAGTTMRSVAKRAGVSTGTIAYYFADKQAMVEAALLEASREYLECFTRTHTPDEDLSLEALIDTFLSHENRDAGLVLQMIEAGLHNARLREVHQRMIAIGSTALEDAIRREVEGGRFRPDIDLTLAAAMLHAVLLWWGSELMHDATTQDVARQGARFALRLLEAPQAVSTPASSRTRGAVAAIRSILRNDPDLSPRATQALGDAIDGLYAALKRSE